MGRGVKLVDLTEFYSERGGGVRSHLDAKNQIACQLGHDSVVVAPGPRTERIAYGSAGAGAGTRTVVRLAGPSTPYDSTYHLLTAPFALRRVLEEERPDVLELHSPYLASLFGVRVPRSVAPVRTFVWHADFVDTYLRPPLEKRASRTWTDRAVEPLWAWVRSIARSVDGTFVASRAQKAKLLDHGCDRVFLVPFGVDRAVFHTKLARDEALRTELLEGRAEPLVVAVGRFAVEKRWDACLAIAERAYAKRPFTLWLFGDGPERGMLEAEAKRLPFLRVGPFERSRERLAAIYRAADCILHACPYETFGLGLAEAVACGAPVVVPDEGGAFEQARDGSSFVYRALDVERGAEALVQSLAEPVAALRAAALENADDVPGFESYMKRMLGYYEQFRREPRP
jgi:alpha-1,6-mannosyltransferase